MEDWVVKTQQALGGLITKPPLKDSLLQRPPLRFIHDIFTSVLRTTGYPEGVFPAHMLDSAKVLETRESKVEWIVRFRRCVELSLGRGIECEPNDVLSGRECQNTNLLLQCLAEAAKQVASLDLQAIAIAVDDSSANVSNFNPRIQTRSQQVQQPHQSQPSQTPPQQQRDQRLSQPSPSAQSQSQAQAPASPQRSRSDDSNQVILTLPLRPIRQPTALPSVAHINSSDFVTVTQTLLGAIINKPPLTPKLLGRPPFRFILDIVISVLSATGHPGGLYSSDELNAEEYKTGSGNKQAWLSKLIAYVATGLNEPSLVERISPRSIAGGVDPHLTNLLLQKFAMLAASGIDPSHIVEVMNNGPAASASSAPSTVSPRPPSAAQQSPQKRESVMLPRHEQETKAQPIQLAGSSMELGLQEQGNSFQSETPSSFVSAPISIASQQHSVSFADTPSLTTLPSSSSGGSGLQRVATARRAPPKAPSALNPSIVGSTSAAPPAGAALAGKGKLAAVIKEGMEIAEEDEEEADEASRDTVKAPALAASEADGQLVRSIQKAISTTQPGESGGLKLGRVQTGRKANTIYSAKQIQDLCAALQKVCASVNPIGRCIEFAPADIAEMEKERVRWRAVADEQTSKLQQQRAMTQESEQTLEQRIIEAEKERDEQLQKTRRLRAQVLANEREIAALLEQHVQ